jgi:hypothetical protein
MNPFIPFIIDESWERDQKRLNAAEQWQRAKRVRANRFSRVDRLRVHIGDQLIALGHFVKAAAQPAPQFDEAPPATSRR